MLASIRDSLNSLIAVTISAAGGKPGKTKPTERPSTAFETVKARRREQKHESVKARVLRKKAPAEQVE